MPGSDVFEPGDLEFYLMGRLESRRSYDYREGVRTDLPGTRYRRCQDIFIEGPHGHADDRPEGLPPGPPVGTQGSGGMSQEPGAATELPLPAPLTSPPAGVLPPPSPATQERKEQAR